MEQVDIYWVVSLNRNRIFEGSPPEFQQSCVGEDKDGPLGH
jgi:hypothetical protein